MTWYQVAGRDELAALALVVPGRDRAEHAGHIRDGGIVRVSERRIHRRQGWTDLGIQIEKTASNDSERKPIGVGCSIEEVLFVGKAIVADNPPIRAKLKRVLAARPGKIVDQLMYGNIDVHGSLE